jgi:structural maintenance of chromosome 1
MRMILARNGISSDREFIFGRWELMTRINVAGASTYHLNSRAVPWNAYNQQLEKFNILVKAKNFLVFQGDVEGVASQDSKALAKLIDRISGYVFPFFQPSFLQTLTFSSLDLAPQYEAAKLAQDKATDASNANFAKKRGMVAEVRHFEEQKTEYRQWEKLRNATVSYCRRMDPWFKLTVRMQQSSDSSYGDYIISLPRSTSPPERSKQQTIN